jgi:hypothetical protein
LDAFAYEAASFIFPAASMPDKRPGQLLSSGSPNKKSKTVSQNDVHSLELGITKAIENDTNLSGISDLIRIASGQGDAQAVHASLYAMYRIFTLLASGGRLRNIPNATDADLVILQWLDARLSDFDGILAGLLQSTEPALRVSFNLCNNLSQLKFFQTASLDILFALLGPLSTSSSASTPRLHLAHFRWIVRAILICPLPQKEGTTGLEINEVRYLHPDVKDRFLTKYLSPFDDVRWFFFRESTCE